MKKVLVTGGYGYIGSHTIKRLAECGYIVDSLDIDPSSNDISPFVRKNMIGDIRTDMYWGNYDAVVHCAALLAVGESVSVPWYYVNTNIIGTKNILKHAPTDNFIFASTAAAFDPASSPYAQSKLLAESIIKEHAKEKQTNYTIFRFFNVAGNNGSFSQIGKATHLIRIAAETAANTRPYMNLFGTDYDTKDGTCIRDFIHVCDLADAVVKAVDKPKNTEYECVASGNEYSCRDVINTMKNVTSINFKVIETDRRSGDPVTSLMPSDQKISDYVDCQHGLDDMCLSVFITEMFKRKVG